MTLDYIADGLDLARIKFLRLSTIIPPAFREARVAVFESSDNYRVLLVELRVAARGL